MLSKDEYVARMKQRLDKWSAEIDILEAQVQKTQDAAKEKYQEQLVALRAQRKEGEEKLAALKSASENSWEQLKVDTENVWAAFKDSVQAFKAHFK